MFSSRRYTASRLCFKSLIHSELIFVYDIRIQFHSFVHGCAVFPMPKYIIFYSEKPKFKNVQSIFINIQSKCQNLNSVLWHSFNNYCAYTISSYLRRVSVTRYQSPEIKKINQNIQTISLISILPFTNIKLCSTVDP